MSDQADAEAQAQSALSHFLLTDEPLEVVLERVVALACAAVPGCSHGSVSLARVGRRITAAATDARILELEGLQPGGSRSPALDAMATGEVQHLDRTGDPPARLADFAAAAGRLGLGAVLCLPLSAGGETVGSLNLYSDQQGGFDDASVAVGRRLADQAAVAVANARAHRDTVDTVAQLTQALVSRALIDQAKGILMARQGCTADEAFELLRRWSQERNDKVQAIAAEMVADVTGQPDQGPSSSNHTTLAPPETA